MATFSWRLALVGTPTGVSAENVYQNRSVVPIGETRSGSTSARKFDTFHKTRLAT